MMLTPLPAPRAVARWPFQLIGIGFLAAVALGCSGASLAQGYPEKTIRIVVPIAAGGSLDRYTRFIAQKLSSSLGRSVIVENRAGANGIIGSDHVAKAPADGYTLLAGASPTLAINPTLYAGKMPYQPEKDFAPISLYAKLPTLIAVHPSVPAKNLKELIALAKARPGQLSFGSSGIGSGNHLVGELLKSEAGINMVHVPYSGGAPALMAVVSGQIEILITPPTTLLPMVRQGRVRAIAVSSAKRSPSMPDVPTISEAAMPGFEATLWFGLVAPAGVPDHVVKTLHKALMPILQSAEYRGLLEKSAATAEHSTPEELGAFIRSEIVKWAKVIKQSGARVE